MTSRSFDDRLVSFIFEQGQLRRQARQGWLRLPADHESIAEHVHRAALLGYLLAHREGYPNPERVAVQILFHDMHETRTGDTDLVEKQYGSPDEVRAGADQMSGLGPLGESILAMWRDVEESRTEAGRIAKDAERLEMAFSARELVVRGFEDAQRWIEGLRKQLQTRGALELLDLIDRADPAAWWKEFLDQRR